MGINVTHIEEGKMIAEHLGKATQAWRIIISNMETEKKIALFSCTQLIIYGNKLRKIE